jgi:hypothetical protein
MLLENVPHHQSPKTLILFSCIFHTHNTILKHVPTSIYLLAVCEQNSSSPSFSTAHYNPLADAALQGPMVEYKGWARERGIDHVPVVK